MSDESLEGERVATPRRMRQTPEPGYRSALEAEPFPARPGRFARNSVFGTVGGLATALGSVLGSVIVAHTLGVENTGIVAFALWIVGVAAVIADLGIQQTLQRYLPELGGAGKAAQARRLTVLLRRPITVTAVTAVCGFAAVAAWGAHRGAWGAPETALWILVGLASGLQALAGFTYGALRGQQQFDRAAVVTAISVLCQLAGMAAGSVWFGVPGGLAGYCLGSALPAALASRYKGSRTALAPEIRRRVVRYSLFAWAAALSSAFVWSRAEVFFLQRSTGSTAVGLFSVGITLANVAAQGPMLLTAALLPHFSQSFGKGELAKMRTSYATATRALAFLVFPACCGLAAVMPAVLPMMFGVSFAAAIPAATVLVLAAGIGAASSVGTSLIMAVDRSDFVFVSGMVAALLTVVAGFTIIPAFGLMGAAWSRAAIQAFAVALGSWFVLYRLRFPLPLADLGKLALAAALCGGTARVCLMAAPKMVSLPLAIVAGIVTYLAAIRALRALPTEDIERFRAIARSLPTRPRRAVDRVLRLLGGAPTGGPTAETAIAAGLARGRHAD